MRLRHAIPFTLIAGLAATACAAAALAPELAVRKAAAELGDDRRASYTISLDGDEGALAAFNDALIAAGSDQAGTSEDMEGIVAALRSSLAVVWDKGDSDRDFEDDAFAVSADVDGIEDAVEARFLNGTIYARAEARRLAEHFGAPAGELDDFVSQAKALGLDFFDEAVDGGWLATDVDPLVSLYKGMADQFGAAFAEEAGFDPSDLGEFGPEMFQAVLDAFGKAYGTDVKVAKGKAAGPGDHYVLSASARKVAEHLLPAIKELPLLEGIPGTEYPTAAEVPDVTYALDLWIRDGNLTRAEFDLSQLPPDGTFPAAADMPRLALRVDIDREPFTIIAPEGVEKLDIFEIFGRLAGSLES